jgi:hypothetical protein
MPSLREAMPLHHPTGAELEFALCFYCQAVLPENPRFRTSARTSLGRRNFCQQDRNAPAEHGCLQQFRRRFS